MNLQKNFPSYYVPYQMYNVPAFSSEDPQRVAGSVDAMQSNTGPNGSFDHHNQAMSAVDLTRFREPLPLPIPRRPSTLTSSNHSSTQSFPSDASERDNARVYASPPLLTRRETSLATNSVSPIMIGSSPEHDTTLSFEAEVRHALIM